MVITLVGKVGIGVVMGVTFLAFSHGATVYSHDLLFIVIRNLCYSCTKVAACRWKEHLHGLKIDL